MKKIIILALVIAVIWIALIFFKNKIGDIRPVTLPPSLDIKERREEEERDFIKTELVFKIAEGFQIGFLPLRQAQGRLNYLSRRKPRWFATTLTRKI